MLESIIKPKKVISGMALAISVMGCGATIDHLDKKTQVWYECNTKRGYASQHPCYEVIQSYLTAQKNYLSTSSSSSDRNYDKGDHDRGDRESKSDKGHSEKAGGGHWECPR